MSKPIPRVERYSARHANQEHPASLRKRVIESLGLARTRQGVGTPKMRVGFIGFDPVAQAMASRILKAGHQLTLYDPVGKLGKDFETAGGRVANSVHDACHCADAVFTMLPDEDVIEAVILGPGGVVESLSGNAIHIGSSTVSVDCSDRIVEAHWNAGKQYVSAPVLVYSSSTAEAQLFVIAGGREAMIIEVEPLLSPIGKLAQLSGWPSDANLFQLNVNCSSANLLRFLARHPEMRAQKDHIETEGVV